mmetsp:Transcript_103681/g.299908  ORF Transcript_103681/g.299908 Transcript_103681/m.299908 type:complete len:233 (+) Transcript_103681:103-801(+)
MISFNSKKSAAWATTALLFILHAAVTTTTLSFTPSVAVASHSTSTSSSALHYVRGDPTEPSIPTKPLKKAATISKPKIRDIKSLDELTYFLEEDDRPVVIKFYAPWCKTCQRLNLHWNRFALEHGDVIQNRHKIPGRIRFASIEYGSETARFITESLKVPGVPTFQIYSGLHKLWEEHGSKTPKSLKEQLDILSLLCPEDIRELAEENDDGILSDAIEESFYDGPDFLNEEW